MARPALQALAGQQKLIEEQAGTIEGQQRALANLTRVAKAQNNQLIQLGHAVQYLAQLAGVEPQLRTAMKKLADSQNPAQPVPEPPAVPPTETKAEAEAPEAMADVQTPGLVPGSTNDVAADAVTTAYTPGEDVGGSAFKELVDVTAPVDGTQNPRPLSETKTLTDVRVGDPMNPQTAFPPRGPFQQQQRTTGAKQNGNGGNAEDASRRMMASLRLARLRMAAHLADGEDLAVAATIEKDASLSLHDIEQEIATLQRVKTANSQRQAPRNDRLVPRTARQRSVPSLQGNGASASLQTTAGLGDVEDASDLFD